MDRNGSVMAPGRSTAVLVCRKGAEYVNRMDQPEADPFIQRLIGKWLNAGFMVGGVVTRTEAGSPQGGPLTPLTQKVILAFRLRAAVLRRTRGDRDTMTNSDGIFPHQNVFNQESHDSLTFD